MEGIPQSNIWEIHNFIFLTERFSTYIILLKVPRSPTIFLKVYLTIFYTVFPKPIFQLAFTLVISLGNAIDYKKKDKCTTNPNRRQKEI